MTGLTSVINITFHYLELLEDFGYSKAHDVYDYLVESLLLLLRSPSYSVSSSTATALDTVDFSQRGRYSSSWF